MPRHLRKAKGALIGTLEKAKYLCIVTLQCKLVFGSSFAMWVLQCKQLPHATLVHVCEQQIGVVHMYLPPPPHCA